MQIKKRWFFCCFSKALETISTTEKCALQCQFFSVNQSWLPACFILQKLVVKPDQLIKRRGKLGLIKAGVDLEGVKEWLKNKLGKEFEVRAAREGLVSGNTLCVVCDMCMIDFCLLYLWKFNQSHMFIIFFISMQHFFYFGGRGGAEMRHGVTF